MEAHSSRREKAVNDDDKINHYRKNLITFVIQGIEDGNGGSTTQSPHERRDEFVSGLAVERDDVPSLHA